MSEEKIKRNTELPSSEELRQELKKEKYKARYRRVLRSTVYVLIVVAAIAALIAVLVLPIIEITGESMTPSLSEGNIAVVVKTTKFESGDYVCFYIGNKLLVKRYIAGPGQWVQIDEDGTVWVDGLVLDEPYVSEKALGECNIDFPIQVPESQIFCLGDQRQTSIDSRNTAVGCIPYDQILGKLVFRVWPLAKFGSLD